jgi:hypothetical protein
MFLVACSGAPAPKAEALVAQEVPLSNATTGVDKAAFIAAAIEEDPSWSPAVRVSGCTAIRPAFEG